MSIEPNKLDNLMHNGQGMTFRTCADKKNHDWTFYTIKRLGPFDGSYEDLYYCRKCMHFAYASEICIEPRTHGEY